MEEILIPLYGACGILSAALYIPLITKLLRDDQAWRGHSLASWGGWFSISIVNLAYAALINHDAKFITAALLGCGALGSVTAIVVVRWGRDRYSRRRLSRVPDLASMIPSGGMGIPAADNDRNPIHSWHAAEG